MKRVIVDTGPLVAYFDRRSEFHDWCREQFRSLTDPLVTCEAVVTETLFLLKRGGLNPDLVLELIGRGLLVIDFDLISELTQIRKLLTKYRDLPATLADVCLVRMSEQAKDCAVFTLDGDFEVYRRNGRGVIPLLAPW